MRTRARTALLITLSLIVAACGSDAPGDTTDDTTPDTTGTTTGDTTPGDTTGDTGDDATHGPVIRPVAMPDRAPSAASPTLAGEAVAAFGSELSAAAATAAAPGANVVVSPLSVAVALGMLEPGTTGPARDQLRELLGIEDPDAWHASMSALEQALESRVAELPSPDPDQDPGEFLARIANAAFLQPGYSFHDAYLQTVGANYGAVLDELDFWADQAAAADRINEFIAEATDDHITDLVQPSDIDPWTVLALVNALLLQASWQQQFAADATVDDDFTRLDGTAVTVPMMSGRSDRSGRGDGWAAATKRLVGDVSLEVVLPDEDRFEEIAGRLDEVIADYVANATDGAALGVPRFETRVRTELTAVLQSLGVTAPFEQGNLLGIADDDSLVVDKVLHETWMSIDETGIEAAAATVVTVMLTSGPIGEPVPVILDRPFLFRIVDDVSGATLFTGRILDPTA